MNIQKFLRNTCFVTMATVMAFGAGTVSAYAADDPAGNNGTIKIDEVEFDSHPDNEPHVGCDFEVDFYGYDEGDLYASVTFAVQPPTGNEIILQEDNIFIGEDANDGGGSIEGLDASRQYDLSDELSAYEPEPNQGYHVKLTVNADGSIGADTKHKVFWIEGCEAAEDNDSEGEPEPTTTPEPTDQPVSTPNPEDGRHSSMGKNGPSCTEDDIEVTYDAKENGTGKKDIEVTFNYKGEEKKVKTNENGRASISYGYKGADSVTAKATDGYPDQAVYVENFSTEQCEVSTEPGRGGAVLGAATTSTGDNEPDNGQVLGSTTVLGATGTFTEDIMTLMKMILGFTTGVVLYLYSKKPATV